MKKRTCIGILGGVGPQATEYLYKKIMSGAVERYGAQENHHFPRLLIISEPVIDFISSTQHLPKAKIQVLQAVKRLIAGGATHVAIASNTVHLLLGDVQKLCSKHSVTFISMLDAVSDYCCSKRYMQVGLLGSPVILQSNIYDTVLKKNEVTLMKPPEAEFEQLGCIIKAVIADSVTESDTNNFLVLVTELVKDVDAVVLGCTELPVLASKLELSCPVVDTSDVLADTLLQVFYATQTHAKKNTKEYTV